MWKKTIFTLCCVALLSTLAGCASITKITQTINSYAAVTKQITLGESKQQVIALLEPLQRGLSTTERKASETYIKNGKTYYLYYMRSRLISDGITTDDEFTPYLFENDRLISIGWTSLGGPKTTAQPSVVRDPTHCISNGFGRVTCF